MARGKLIKSPKRGKKYQARKEQILKTALDLFSTRGYAQTSIRDIATKAHVNVATIYYYFSNKEEILYEIIKNNTIELIRQLVAIQNNVVDPLQALSEMIKFQVLYSLKEWEGAKLIVVESEHNLHRDYMNKCRMLQRELYEIYLKQIIMLKNAGILRDIDAKICVFSIFGILNWLHRWYRKEGPLDPHTLASSIVKLIMNGICTIDVDNYPPAKL